MIGNKQNYFNMKKTKLFFKRLLQGIILVILAGIIFVLAGIMTVIALIISIISIPYYTFTGKGLIKIIENKLIQK